MDRYIYADGSVSWGAYWKGDLGFGRYCKPEWVGSPREAMKLYYWSYGPDKDVCPSYINALHPMDR